MPVRLWLFVCAALLIAGGLGGAWLMVRLSPEPAPQPLEAARLAEAELLRSQGLLAAEKATRAQLEAQAADLRQEIEKVRRASPGAVVTSAGQVTTGPIEAKPGPLPGWYQVPMFEKALAPPPAGSMRRCLLHEGDSTDLAAEWAGLETEKGNRVLVGRALAIRLDPGPAETIITAPIKADASRFLVATAQPGWGAGGIASLSLDRAAVGVLVSPPPRGRREILLGAGVEQFRGGRGAWVSVGVVWRRMR